MARRLLLAACIFFAGSILSAEVNVKGYVEPTLKIKMEEMFHM